MGMPSVLIRVGCPRYFTMDYKAADADLIKQSGVNSERTGCALAVVGP
jgi:hypothetical protein